MDYSSMFEGRCHPSDIDMIYFAGKYLILGEIKNETGTFKKGQNVIYEKLLNGWQGDGVILHIVHDKYFQNGDTTVDVPECYIKEFYASDVKRWQTPKRPTKVKELLTYCDKRWGDSRCKIKE